MGKRGPKPTPQAVLKLRQSWRANLNRLGPKVDQKRPQRPHWLIGEARKCWDRLVPLLEQAGLLAQLYREPLAMLCSAWADYVEADQQLAKMRNKDGTRALLVTSGKAKEGEKAAGAVMENPLLYTRHRAWQQVMKAAGCFGLTPEDMANVRALEVPGKKEEAKAKFFGGAG